MDKVLLLLLQAYAYTKMPRLAFARENRTNLSLTVDPKFQQHYLI